MPTPCNPNVAATGLAPDQADQLILRAKRLAEKRVFKTGQPVQDALKEIAGELIAEEKTMAKIHERNQLLAVRAKQVVKDYTTRFKTFGDGLLAFLQGSVRNIPGARLSVDYQVKALHGKYFGRIVAEMEKAGVLTDFKNPSEQLTQDVYREMGAMIPGQPAKAATKNEVAFKIAQIIDSTWAEMVARQNRAGAYIKRLPGYVARQTHSQEAIRSIGLMGNTRESKESAYKAWRDFVLPLIDEEKTMMGEDPEKFLRNVHESLYSGIHGPARDEMDVQGVLVTGSLAKKASQSRLLHFKGPDEAYKYNQAFGIKDLKEQILYDVHTRARSIALMENLGPSPEAGLRQIIRELEDEARVRDDAGVQIDSLKNWRIQAAMNEITGHNEFSSNPTLSNITGTVKVLTQMAKMGGVVLSSFTDKAFLQSEMAFQGISNLQTLAHQFIGMAKRSTDELQTLRMMGVAMDGLIGNALSRYSNHSSVSGWGHSAQKWFFQLNGLNLWTDANKATAAELMAAHLGEHSHLPFSDLPGDLAKVLALYDISSSRWEAIRMTSVDARGSKMVLPDQLSNIPNETIATVVKERGLNPTVANIQRERDAIETALRTYYMDRVDMAVPTPGAAERKYSTWDTKAGTPIGEALRMMMLFKSFPITVLRKVVGRNIYGNGANTVMDWLLHDHRGKFNMAQLIAMATVAGYVSGAVRDALKGRNPKPLILEDGTINTAALNDAALRGGALGIMGDVLMSEYADNYGSFLQRAAGPIVGQLDAVAQMKTQLMSGKSITGPAEKLVLDNLPGINLFYIRPVLDYYVLWNLQEMMSPGSLQKMESAVERRNHQTFFMKPSRQ